MSKYDRRIDEIKPLTLEDWTGAINSDSDIQDILERLEDDNDIEILYACMVGSRIYG